MKKLLICLPVVMLFACNHTKEQNSQRSADSTAASNTRAVDSIMPVISVDSTASAVPDYKLIVPGKSIGITAIGQKSEETGKDLGTPDDGDAAMGKSLSTWYSKNNPAYKTQVFSAIQMGKEEDMPRVKSIRVNNPFFETASHLKAGSNLKEILAQFPAMLLTGSYESSAKKPIKLYDDSEAGIAFEIDETDTCVGINVHTKGEKAFMQYLPFESSFVPVDN
ncbi:MAG: hypothetical protein H7Y86_17560 [Rhizobacter sp.]|nr:hypothetical protein [Ferruginibacter sp.]